MQWKKTKHDLPDGEFVVRLRGRNMNDSFWLGRSVHQIATQTNEGDVYCLGRKISRDEIDGWMPLPSLVNT